MGIQGKNAFEILRAEMTNSVPEECRDVNKNVVRPTFLSLSLKRSQFYPTLPMTPEHAAGYETTMGITNCDVIDWDILASSNFSIHNKRYTGEESDVFPETPRKRREDCDEVISTTCHSATAKEKARSKARLPNFCRIGEAKDEGKCCSQWVRAYLRRLWVKAPEASTTPPVSPKPRQPSILEREFSQKPKSPRGLKRTIRKRQNATSTFVYSAFIEDPVRELHEERHDDVIYAITMKKDTLPRNSASFKSLSSGGDVMKEKNTTKHLKGATLDHMVGRLARVFVADGEDANFLNVFLTTYRTFASPEELFTKLSDEYTNLKTESETRNAAILRSIIRVLRAWLERYAQDDFVDTPGHQLLRRLLALAREHDEEPINAPDDVISPRRSPITQRKNGIAGGFADYVAAKLAVAGVQDRKEKAFAATMPSPTHTQNPLLDVTVEGTDLNMEPSRQLLLALSSRYLAAQLTVIDAKLFHRVQPHHCLAAVVSSKNRPVTVQATIDEFNRVVYCVVATVLCPGLKLVQRTKILTKWIEVAQECRELKNFSSLRAIVSGLQTYALHRLKRAWSSVPHSHTNLLKELAELNMKDLIMKVGTAKVNTEDSSITKVRKDAAVRRHQDMHSGIVHGTVPYLGSFLTDLTYLDTARPDFLEGGLINFEKRRKEFELLAQLQLWQASCRSYQHLEPDPLFIEWFKSYTVLTDDQTFKLSEIIEPAVSSVSSPALNTSPLKRTISDKLFNSYGHGDVDGENAGTPNHNKNVRKHENGVGPTFSQSFNGRIGTPSPGAQNRIVKVRLVRKPAKATEDTADGKDRSAKPEYPKDDLSSSCEYKTITISSNERTAAVIRKALDLYMLDVEANLKRFSLVQVLHDSPKEIRIPDSANVFYAMSSSDLEPTLVLLEEGAEISNKVKRHQSTPYKPKKHRHRKNHSLSYIRDSESNALRVASSPMKSFYQIALGSVALVGGSYSPSVAARRSSDGEDAPSQVQGDGGVVLLNTKTGVDAKRSPSADRKSWHLETRQIRSSMSDASGLDLRGVDDASGNRSFRCYSADYTSTVVLPIRVVQSSRALTLNRTKPSKSAPCSPQSQRRMKAKGAFDEDVSRTSNRDIIIATGRLIEWPRHSTSTTYASKSATWSSRRAVRKTRKPQSKSTFYVQEGALGGKINPAKNSTEQLEPASRSKFYVDMTPAHCEATDGIVTAKTVPIRPSTSKTLPSGFSPNFSGHDYEEISGRPPISNEHPVQKKGVPLSQWESPSGKKMDSFASISSTHSTYDAASSDSGSFISFIASPSEDNVFDYDEKTRDDTPTNTTPSAKLADFSTKVTITPPDDLALDIGGPPLIKIQCASPDNCLDDLRTPRLDGSNSDSECEFPPKQFTCTAQNAVDLEDSTYL